MRWEFRGRLAYFGQMPCRDAGRSAVMKPIRPAATRLIRWAFDQRRGASGWRLAAMMADAERALFPLRADPGG